MSITNVPKAYYSMGQHWIKTTLESLPDYHYLNGSHLNLIPKLNAELERMAATGELTSLQKTYGLASRFVDRDTNEFGTITAASSSWYQFTDSEDATYLKMLDLIYANLATDVSSQISNWKRAKQRFYEKQVDILIGAYAFESGDDGIHSDIHIDYEIPVTAYAQSGQVLDSILTQGQPGSACYILGYGFDEILPESVGVYESPNIGDCIRMVENGRVDMFLDYELDLFESEIERFEQRQVLEGLPLFMVFQNTSRGRALKYHFDSGMRELIKSGKLRSIFPSEQDYANARFTVKAPSSPH